MILEKFINLAASKLYHTILNNINQYYTYGSYYTILYNIIQYYTYDSYDFVFFPPVLNYKGHQFDGYRFLKKTEPSHHKSPVFNRLQHNFPEVERKT